MKDFLSRHINISEEECSTFISHSDLIHFEKNEHLIYSDKIVNKLFFIKKGLVRGYRLVEGLDITHHFFLENWFATDYESYLTAKPGELFLQAIVDTSAYVFEKYTLLTLYKENSKFEKIRSLQAEHAYLHVVERLKDLQTKDLKKRYNSLIQKSPDLFNLVSQKHIASYLGVAPQSLSRIKKQVQKPKT